MNLISSYEIGRKEPLRKRGTRKNITAQILPSWILYYRTLPSRALSLAPLRVPQSAGKKVWTASPTPRADPGSNSPS